MGSLVHDGMEVLEMLAPNMIKITSCKKDRRKDRRKEASKGRRRKGGKGPYKGLIGLM